MEYPTSKYLKNVEFFFNYFLNSDLSSSIDDRRAWDDGLRRHTLFFFCLLSSSNTAAQHVSSTAVSQSSKPKPKSTTHTQPVTQPVLRTSRQFEALQNHKSKGRQMQWRVSAPARLKFSTHGLCKCRLFFTLVLLSFRGQFTWLVSYPSGAFYRCAR